MWAGWDVEALAIHFSPFISGRPAAAKAVFLLQGKQKLAEEDGSGCPAARRHKLQIFFASSFFRQDGQLSKLVFFNLQRKQELTGDFHPRWPQKGVKAARIFGDGDFVVWTICKTKRLFDH